MDCHQLHTAQHYGKYKHSGDTGISYHPQYSHDKRNNVRGRYQYHHHRKREQDIGQSQQKIPKADPQMVHRTMAHRRVPAPQQMLVVQYWI